MAVRIRFDVFNDFYEHLRTVYGNDDDPISAGGQSNRMQHYADFENFIRQQHPDSAYPVYFPDWEFINLNDTSKNLICSVDTVRFSDGTIWQAPNQPFTQTGVGKAFAAYMKSPAAMDFYSVKKPIQP